MKLALGKLPPEVLSKYLLNMLGAASKDLALPPGVGVDFGAVRLKTGYLIVSSDPITGVTERIGWYAVNASANDVATSGNRPRFLQSVILLPEDASLSLIEQISTEMDQTAKKLGISIIGGHTELSPGLKRPIVITTAFTVADSYVSAADAREGDTIMLTKSAGVEGTAILGSASRRFPGRISPELARRAERYFGKLSVVEECTSAYSTGWVTAMHDSTEGGVLGALYEMAYASGVGFEVFESEIPVSEETAKICSALNVDALKLISSGTLLLAVKKGKEKYVSEALRKVRVPVASIGSFGRGGKWLVRSDGSRERIDTAAVDEIWRIGTDLFE